jgi:hypothetical protein
MTCSPTVGAEAAPTITQVKRGRSFPKYSRAPRGPRRARFDWGSTGRAGTIGAKTRRTLPGISHTLCSGM